MTPHISGFDATSFWFRYHLFLVHKQNSQPHRTQFSPPVLSRAAASGAIIGCAGSSRTASPPWRPRPGHTIPAIGRRVRVDKGIRAASRHRRRLIGAAFVVPGRDPRNKSIPARRKRPQKSDRRRRSAGEELRARARGNGRAKVTGCAFEVPGSFTAIRACWVAAEPLLKLILHRTWLVITNEGKYRMKNMLDDILTWRCIRFT